MDRVESENSVAPVPAPPMVEIGAGESGKLHARIAHLKFFTGIVSDGTKTWATFSKKLDKQDEDELHRIAG